MSTSNPATALEAVVDTVDRDHLPASQVHLAPAASMRVAMASWGVGLLGVVACLVGAQSEPVAAFASYHAAYMLYLALALGSLAFVLIHHVTGARWGVVVRRIAEAIASTLPLFVILFVPILLGKGHLFSWMRPEVIATDHLVQEKAGYLNTPFFLIRAFAYFAIWTFFSVYLARLSLKQDEGKGEALLAKMRKSTAPAILLFALSLTFAAFDWLMSVSPHWFSTMFGVYYFAGAFQAALALIILVTLAIQKAGLLRGIVTVEHHHDLGKFLFAFTVFYAYIAFCQYFLIWYANIPEETFWFLERWEGGWSGTALAMIFTTFVIPFLLLLAREPKRRAGTLIAASVIVLLGRAIEMYWLVMPSLKVGPTMPWTTLAATVGVGGLFLGTIAWRLGKGPLVPIGDPYLRTSLGHENV